MPSSSAPSVRNDRLALEAWEWDMLTATLFDAAELINSLTRTGSIYGRTPLPPEMAERKRMLMEQQGGQ